MGLLVVCSGGKQSHKNELVRAGLDRICLHANLRLVYTRTHYVPDSREPDTILTVEREELVNTLKECMPSIHLHILRYTGEGRYNIRVFILSILQYHILGIVMIRTKYEVCSHYS